MISVVLLGDLMSEKVSIIITNIIMIYVIHIRMWILIRFTQKLDQHPKS